MVPLVANLPRRVLWSLRKERVNGRGQNSKDREAGREAGV